MGGVVVEVFDPRDDAEGVAVDVLVLRTPDLLTSFVYNCIQMLLRSGLTFSFPFPLSHVPNRLPTLSHRLVTHFPSHRLVTRSYYL